MTEYISREAVLKEIQPRYAPAINKVLAGIIESVPAADVKPVVHGTWVWNDDGMDFGLGCWVCGVCKSKPETNWEATRNITPKTWNGSNFCPNCGAKMDLVRK